MQITIKHKGEFKKTSNFLARITNTGVYKDLRKYGEEGVAALANATPIDTGETARSWYYEIEKTSTGISIVWKNRNLNKNVPIAVLIQYGHGTATGGYVRGIDYINPALRPVFKSIADSIWKEVRG